MLALFIPACEFPTIGLDDIGSDSRADDDTGVDAGESTVTPTSDPGSSTPTDPATSNDPSTSDPSTTTKTTSESSSSAQTSEPPPDTTTDATTTTTTSDTSTTDEPIPPITPRCTLASDDAALAAACAGDPDCPIREVLRLQCTDQPEPPRITRAPGDDAVLYQKAGIDDEHTNHEAFRLTQGASGPAGLWMTESSVAARGDLLAASDGGVELFFRGSPALHYLAGADQGPDGYSQPDAIRDDIAAVVGSATRPDDVPVVYYQASGEQGRAAIFDFPDDRTEQPILGIAGEQLAIDAVAGTLWLTWVADDQNFDQYLWSRPLAGDPDAAGSKAALISDSFGAEVGATALSPFGDGTHGVVLTIGEPTEGPRVIAGAPWTRDEALDREPVDCVNPTCADGCEAAPPCDEQHIETVPVGLQAGPDHLRMWHLECPYESVVQWQESEAFDLFCLCFKCFCAEKTIAKTELPCALVGSLLLPDPNFAGRLRRVERWRRDLGFTRSEVTDISAAASGDTLWAAFDGTILAADAAAPADPASCGDDVVQGNEACDGAALTGECDELAGFGGGTLGCSNSCTLDTADCCKLLGGTCLTSADCCDPASCQFDLFKLKFTCQ